MTLWHILAPVIVTGLFSISATWLTVRYGKRNSDEHGSVLEAVQNLTTRFDHHLQWHAEDTTTKDST